MTNTGLNKSAFTPKSDQLNADDLIGGSVVINITGTTYNQDPQQPCSIHYDGDNGKPYKPNKGMGRILEEVWGYDWDKWIGHSLELFRDPTIRFGRDTVGGIRIGAMTGIQKECQFLVTVSRGKRVQHTVKPLAQKQAPSFYSDETFNKDIDAMTIAIKGGKSSVAKVISHLEKTAPLTQAQIDKLNSIAQKAAMGS